MSNVMQREYLAYTDRYVSVFKPDEKLLENVRENTKFTSTNDGIPFVDIPLVLADEWSTRGYGRFIVNNDDAQVQIVQWPTKFRKVHGGSDGGIVKGDFMCRWIDNEVHVVNKAVSNNYPKGWRDAAGNIFTQGADYHPDGEQIFLPIDKNPFIIILSKHRHDNSISPLSFVAFHFDGSQGFAVRHHVYHQAVFPLKEQVHLRSIQGKVHGVVMMDAFREFGVYMRIPNAFEHLPPVSHNWMLSMNSKMIKVVPAEDSNIKPFGRLINNFDTDSIKILQWPSAGHRPVWMGNECGVKTQQNTYLYNDNGVIIVDGKQVGLRDRNKILTNSLFSRPDGSCIVFPIESEEPFFMLFAIGMVHDLEEVDPNSFTALLIQPGQGVFIREHVWHSVPFPQVHSAKMTFNEAFSAVNTVIEDDLYASFDFIIEMNL